MPKSKSLGERFIRQEGGGGGTKKVSKIYSSGTDPYQEGGGRRKGTVNFVDVRPYLDLVLPTIRDRRVIGSKMIGTRAEHLAKIRPNPEDNRRTVNPRNTTLGDMLVHSNNWRKSKRNYKTRYHTHTTGWYLHGPNAGEPRPGRKAAMIRAYTIAALDDFQHPGRTRSQHFIDIFREIKEDLYGQQYKPRKKKRKNNAEG